jgi:hypothetical protein
MLPDMSGVFLHRLLARTPATRLHMRANQPGFSHGSMAQICRGKVVVAAK